MTPVTHRGIHHNNLKLEMVEYTVYNKQILQDTVRIKHPKIEIKNDLTVISGINGIGTEFTLSIPTNHINLYGLSLAYTQVYKRFNSMTPDNKMFDEDQKTVVDKYYVKNGAGLNAELIFYYTNPSFVKQPSTPSTESTVSHQTNYRIHEPVQTNSALEYLNAISKDYENLLNAESNKNKAVKEYQFFNRLNSNNKKNLTESIKENSVVNITDEEALTALKNLLRNNMDTFKVLLNYEK